MKESGDYDDLMDIDELTEGADRDALDAVDGVMVD